MRRSGAFSTTAILAIVALFALAAVPLTARGEPAGTTATMTLSVTIPPSPVVANVLPGCQFVVVQGQNKAYCTATLIVADPTLINQGWRVSLGISSFSNACGGSLVSNSLIIDSHQPVQLINGQPVDSKGGPSKVSNSVGQKANPSNPLLVAKPGYGNGAYALTMVLRLSYPAKTKPCTYLPTFAVAIQYGSGA
jgi:hypothetical protein